MKGILAAIGTPFLPVHFYDRLNQSKLGKREAISAFFFLLISSGLIHHFSSPEPFTSIGDLCINRLGFTIGWTLRIILISYILSITLTRITNVKVTTRQTFSIVILASSTQSYPLILNWLGESTCFAAYFLSQAWFGVILSIGIWRMGQLPFLKSLGFVSIALALFELIVCILIPHGMIYISY